MLEYFLFYFAYALTLDDDDSNGRGLRRVIDLIAERGRNEAGNKLAFVSNRAFLSSTID